MRHLAFILLLLAFGCSSTNETVVIHGTFPVNPKTKEALKMSNFVEFVSYIKLETTPDFKSVVKGIKDVYVDEDNLFVYDYYDGSVQLFDLKGKYKHKIGAKG